MKTTIEDAQLSRCCGPEDCGSAPNDGPGGHGRYCLTVGCMAWRWGQKPNPSYNPNAGQSWPQPHPPTPMYIEDTGHGYCGLAGRA